MMRIITRHLLTQVNLCAAKSFPDSEKRPTDWPGAKTMGSPTFVLMVYWVKLKPFSVTCDVGKCGPLDRPGIFRSMHIMVLLHEPDHNYSCDLMVVVVIYR